MSKLFQNHSVHNKHLTSVRNTGDIKEHAGLTQCFPCFTQGYPWDANCQTRNNPKPSYRGVKSPEMTQKLVQGAGSTSGWQGAKGQVRGHRATGSCLPSPWRIPEPFQLLRRAATGAVRSHQAEFTAQQFLSFQVNRQSNAYILWYFIETMCQLNVSQWRCQCTPSRPGCNSTWCQTTRNFPAEGNYLGLISERMKPCSE